MDFNKKEEAFVLCTSGGMGSGFGAENFYRVVRENKPDVIAADAGSTDDGPFYLGEGVPRTNHDAAKWEIRHMLLGGVPNGIPVLVGSAATAGADPNVDWLVNIVKEVAAEEGLHFRLAEIKSELDKETLRKYMRAGKMKPLENAPEFTEKDLDELHRCVAVMGAEAYQEALKNGADVVIAGRSTDTAIFSAVPMMKGINPAYAWHAGKVLECGNASAANVKYADCMLAWVRNDSLSVEPAEPTMYSTPLSVAAHTLYENTNPFVLVEPGGAIHTENCTYEAENERRVRVTGTEWVTAEQYTLKLEGVKYLGYRRVVIGGVGDPLILRQLNRWLDRCVENTRTKIEKTMGIPREDYMVRYIVYGNPEAENPGEVGVMFEVIAKNPVDADAITGTLWHLSLHVPIPEWEGMQSQIAFPVSPETLDGGRAYTFCLNHVLEVDDPLELLRFKYYDL